MSVFKKSVADFALCLVELVAGILLLLDPIRFTSTVLIGGGVVLIALGVIEVVNYFRTDARIAAFGQMLTKGLVLLLIGVFCTVQWRWFLVTFPVWTMVYGIVILLTGVSKIQVTVDMLRLKSSRWGWAAVNAALTLICAVVILRSPFASTEVLWMFTGVALVAVGVFDLVVLLFCKKGKGADTP